MNPQDEHGQKAMWVVELQRAAGDREEAAAKREDARKGERLWTKVTDEKLVAKSGLKIVLLS